MHKSRIPLLVVTIVLFLTVAWLKNKQQELQPTTESELTTNSTHSPLPFLTGPPLTTTSTTTPTVNLQNSRYMTQILRHSVYKSSLKKTIDLLQKAKTTPLYLKEDNPFTGTLHLIKTESPLKGTRHFHAQFFSQKKTTPFLQHMSFEIPPGKNSFPTAVRLLKESFQDLPAHPEIQKDGFIMWRWKGAYNIWALRLTKDHLQSDPFNAYEANDEGSVRIAVELDIPHNHASY